VQAQHPHSRGYTPLYVCSPIWLEVYAPIFVDLLEQLVDVASIDLLGSQSLHKASSCDILRIA